MKKSILMAGLLLLGGGSGLALAQVQVVESGLGQPQGRNVAQTAGGSNDLLLSLYNQMEALQQEVQTLRGMAEEQARRLQRLETESRSRYIDLDSRLSALSGAEGQPVEGEPVSVPSLPGAAGAAAAGSAAPNRDVRTALTLDPVPGAARSQTASTPSTAAAGAVAVDPAAQQMSEQDLYRNALNLLLEEGKSAESAAMFQVYAQRFPQGRLLPNALYWQGEALILLARYPEALAAFERVLNDFSGDAKAAGAMLKAGVVQNLMGNRSEAERLWRELPARFPDSASEIALARDYLGRP